MINFQNMNVDRKFGFILHSFNIFFVLFQEYITLKLKKVDFKSEERNMLIMAEFSSRLRQ